MLPVLARELVERHHSLPVTIEGAPDLGVAALRAPCLARPLLPLRLLPGLGILRAPDALPGRALVALEHKPVAAGGSAECRACSKPWQKWDADMKVGFNRNYCCERCALVGFAKRHPEMRSIITRIDALNAEARRKRAAARMLDPNAAPKLPRRKTVDVLSGHDAPRLHTSRLPLVVNLVSRTRQPDYLPASRAWPGGARRRNGCWFLMEKVQARPMVDVTAPIHDSSGMGS